MAWKDLPDPADRSLSLASAELERRADELERLKAAPKRERELSAKLLQQDRPIIPVRQWIADPYYVGSLANPPEHEQGGLFAKLREDLEDIFEGGPDGKGFFECYFSGCIDLDAHVLGADGSLPTVRESIGRPLSVATLLANGRSESSGGRHSGVQRTVKISLRNGMEVRATPDHLIQVVRGDGTQVWAPAAMLRIGDYVAVPRRWDAEPRGALTEAEARLLGYWCADGSCGRYRARYCDGNPATSLDVLAIMRSLGFDGVRYPKGKAWEIHAKRSLRSGYIAWLSKHGLGPGPKSFSVAVPPDVTKAKAPVLAAFFNALWAAEGTVYANLKAGPPTFQLGMVSERFIRQVQLLLLRFGIQSKIRLVHSHNKKRNKTYSHWLLVISGIENLRAFLASIGDVRGKEAACERVRAYCARRKNNTNVDVVPITHEKLVELLRAAEIRIKPGSRWCRLWMRKGYLSRIEFDRFCQEFSSAPAVQRLARGFPSDVRYEPITEIGDGGTIEVGDIAEVVDGQRWIANGIGVHNSVGWGKTAISRAIALRSLYLVSCYARPQYAFKNMTADDTIVYLNFNVTEEKARLTFYRALRREVDSIQYFKDCFLPEVRTEKVMKFPKSVLLRPAVASEEGATSENLVFAVCDEVNKWPDVDDSERSDTDGRHYDAAQVVYDALLTRMINRFGLPDGTMPPAAKLILISSATTPDSFIARRIRFARETNRRVKILNYREWDTRQRSSYDAGGWFYVGVAPTGKKHEIIDVPDKAVAQAKCKALEAEGYQIHEAPRAKYLQRFRDDVDRAIRDILGFETETIQPFIKRREVLPAAIRQREHIAAGFNLPVGDLMRHPMTEVTTNLRDGVSFIRETLVQKDPERDRTIPIVNPKTPRFLHIDLSSKKDATGFVMGHVFDRKEIYRRAIDRAVADGETPAHNGSAHPQKELAPVVWIDLSLRIVAPKGEEIDPASVRSLVTDLRSMGFRFAQVTYDGWPGAIESKIRLTEEGFNVAQVSVDKTTEPYFLMRRALYESRLLMYRYEPLLDELSELEYYALRDAVDHRPGPAGRKDVSDALTAVVWACETLGMEGAFRISDAERQAMMPRIQVAAQWSQDERARRRRTFKPESDPVVDFYLGKADEVVEKETGGRWRPPGQEAPRSVLNTKTFGRHRG